jgi:hypothetical protein
MRAEIIGQVGMCGKGYIKSQGEKDIIKIALKEVGYEDVN